MAFRLLCSFSCFLDDFPRHSNFFDLYHNFFQGYFAQSLNKEKTKCRKKIKVQLKL